ncbi:hypothetical protein WME90_42685 [Sorangium sp. So ce375]|uniref:hypothetical protein n=1 Tax=Sorangium sp. So ce375 TaxID=3133306 RepID=UPI003F5B5C81
MSFVKYACWSDGEINTFVRTTALEGGKAVFLGVHLPIVGFECVAGQLPEPTEEALFQALLQRRAHVLVVVEGEPGSGKSHLIQWLRYRWPGDGNDHVVVVPRSDGSLLGALERLRTELGEPFAEPLRGLGQVAEHSLEGRAQAFLGQLVTFCQKTSYAQGLRLPKHADWLDHTSAWRILNHNALRSEWPAPREIVNILGGAEGKRDQRMARFAPAHVVQMVELILASGGKIGSLAPQALFVQLQREVNSVVRGVVKEHRDDDVDTQIAALGNGAPNTTKLLEALDARCEHAVQGLLGIQRDELQKRFLEVRRRLRAANRRLVLLLEDITNLQGVDQQLIEALLPSPATPEESDLCDLVAVLGVTPEYHQKAIEGHGNLRDRLAFHIRLTTSDEDEVLKRKARFLLDPEIRARFVATYLNAVRTTHVRMKAWVERDPDSPRPNACETCPRRKPCHAAFGSVTIPKVAHGPVGLYPFTRDSIERFWGRLTDPERKRTQQTPRGLLINVISVGLKQREDLVRGHFPTEEFEHRSIDKIRPGARLNEPLEKVSAPEERKRLTRAIVWWGDKDDGSVRTESGGRIYSGIPQGVMAAFALEWPGEGIIQPAPEDALDTDAGETPAVAMAATVEVIPVAAPAPAEKSAARQNTKPQEAVPSAPPPPKHESVLPREWRERIEHLDGWAGGDDLVSPTAWESLLFSAFNKLAPEELGSPRWLWHRTMTEDNVVLQGTRQNPDTLQLVIQRGPVVHHGLTSLAWLRHGTVADEVKLVEHFGHVARFQAELARRAVEHVRGIEAKVKEYLGGDPGELAAKALVVLAWLWAEPPAQGERPLPAAQWQLALRTRRSRAGLTKSWTSLGESYQGLIDALREIVAETERVGQEPQTDTSLDSALLDPAAIERAVRELVEAPTRWQPTQKTFPAKKLREFLAPVHYIVGKLRAEFESAIEAEDHATLALVKAIDGHTGGNDVEGFLARTRQTVEGLKQIDPNFLPTNLATEFSQSLKEMSQCELGAGSEGVRAADDAIAELTGAPPEADIPTKLMRVVRAPRLNLATMHKAVDLGARAIQHAHDKASCWMAESGVEGTDEIEAAAARIEQAAKKVVSALGKGGGDA